MAPVENISIWNLPHNDLEEKPQKTYYIFLWLLAFCIFVCVSFLFSCLLVCFFARSLIVGIVWYTCPKNKCVFLYAYTHRTNWLVSRRFFCKWLMKERDRKRARERERVEWLAWSAQAVVFSFHSVISSCSSRQNSTISLTF